MTRTAGVSNPTGSSAAGAGTGEPSVDQGWRPVLVVMAITALVGAALRLIAAASVGPVDSHLIVIALALADAIVAGSWIALALRSIGVRRWAPFALMGAGLAVSVLFGIISLAGIGTFGRVLMSPDASAGAQVESWLRSFDSAAGALFSAVVVPILILLLGLWFASGFARVGRGLLVLTLLVGLPLFWIGSIVAAVVSRATLASRAFVITLEMVLPLAMVAVNAGRTRGDGTWGLAGTFALLPAALVFGFAAAGPLGPAFGQSQGRAGFTLTLLQDGTILVAGGTGSQSVQPSDVAEIYDPATNGWSPTSRLRVRRAYHTATALENGRVLVTGGRTSAIEIYDPTTAQWAGAVGMNEQRSGHAAVRMADGRVLVVGGTSNSSAEIYNPITAQWSPTSSMNASRSTFSGDGFTALLLRDARILVLGGTSGDEPPQVYDPSTDAWSDILGAPKTVSAAILLADGTVLVLSGGASMIYDPTADSWLDGGGSGLGATQAFVMVRLADRTVLVAGGTSGSTVPSDARIYNPETRTWSATGRTSVRRANASMISLLSGKALIVGGVSPDGHGDLSSAELYDPARGAWSQAGNMNSG